MVEITPIGRIRMAALVYGELNRKSEKPTGDSNANYSVNTNVPAKAESLVEVFDRIMNSEGATAEEFKKTFFSGPHAGKPGHSDPNYKKGHDVGYIG